MAPRFLQIAHGEVAHADVPNLPGPVQRLERHHRLPQGDLAPRVGPVNLVQIDFTYAQTLQARGARLPDIVRAQMPTADLRGNEDMVPAHILDRLTHDRFGVTVAVRLRCVDEVDAQFDGAFHRLAGIDIPHVVPPRFAAGLPHPEADRRHLRTTATERNVLHESAAMRHTTAGQKPIERRGRTTRADGRAAGNG